MNLRKIESYPLAFSKLLCFIPCIVLLQGDATGVASDVANKGQPNIIFILADDQGWNGTSVQMHPNVPGSKSDYYLTPNLEKLASQGLRFSQAYAPAPMCAPSRASFQIGKSPAQLRMTNVGRGSSPQPWERLELEDHSSKLPADEITIGEQLQSVGYSTAWFGKWHLGNRVGPGSHGYDDHDGATGNSEGVTEDPKNPKDIFGITERGIKFMEQNVKAKKPFYLQLWHYAVHDPIETKPESERAAANRRAGRTHFSTTVAGMTADLDTSVGMIVDKVDEMGISDNTYIVYMSDHGAGLNVSSNLPLALGKGCLTEGALRVPLIIRGPGVAADAHSWVPTVGWDLYPTFCSLAGVKNDLPEGIEGINLQPLLKTGSWPDQKPKRDAIAFHFPHYGQGATRSPHSTIIIDGFKLYKHYEWDLIQLYDLSKDIGERNDLAEQMPAKVQMLSKRLDEYLAKVDAGMPSPNDKFDPNATVQHTPPGTSGRGNREERIAERKKELETLEAAVKEGDFEKIAPLLDAMAESLDSGSSGSSDRRSRFIESRQQDLAELQAALKEKDIKMMNEALAKIKDRSQGSRRGSRNGGGDKKENSKEKSEPEKAESP